MIRGFRAISRAVATVAISAGLVGAVATGASAMVTAEGDMPAVTVTATDPVPDVAVEDVAETPAVESPVPDVPVPDLPVPLPLPELPTAGLLDGLLAAVGSLLSSLLGGLGISLPLPIPGT
jgi:hypothetical protein